MKRKILVADLLCGAGGSSTGCERALKELGLEMELVCLNHWPVAIETHTKNHPNARHFVQDISTVQPHIIVPEGYLDLLMASPTCTHHSVARGGKPTSDQQRSDPWHIITWFTQLRVKRAIIENVWEFTGWGPVDARTGKPIKSRKGEYFLAWVDTIWKLGATSIEWRKLNAADYGDATTRQRFIMMIRFDGKPISWPVPTHHKREDGKLTLFPGVKPWRPAREIIDWDLKGKSIFNRKKPLAPKTLARIYAGAQKFGWPEPFLVILRNHMAGQSVDQPIPTVAANGLHIGLAQPIAPTFEEWIADTKSLGGSREEYDRLYGPEAFHFANRTNNPAKGMEEPVSCLTTAHGGGIAVAQPITLSQHNSGAARSTEEPLPTITTGGAATPDHPGCARPMLAEPVIMNGRKNNQAKAVSTDPVPTLDTKGGVWLAEPFIATVAHGNEANERDPNYRRSKSIDDPLGAVHGTGSSYAVVEPFILSRQAEGAPRTTDEPMCTQTAQHSPVLVSAYYGANTSCTSEEEPLPTVTTKDRFGIVIPVTHSKSGNQARDVDNPVPTMTTAKGGEFGLVLPVTHAGGHDRVLDANGDPLPTITGANRGELAFITAQHGEREGQAPRVHDIDQPAPTIAASGHVDLAQGIVQPAFDGQHIDILFRMLEPHELAAAMGFTTEDQTYEFAGTKTEQIKQIGNAVSVAKMKACVGAIMADAAPKKKLVAAPISDARAA